ncbi:response regulator transcription factor [Thermoflexus sp.]|uniref:winged helix-turn-helix transcriptional regulator n=1 Tax=Thermoflexus sp. TaxID=1969742 RepID=UPI0017723396|nr:response regulator transcription factor [Thermoflexus sp.]
MARTSDQEHASLWVVFDGPSPDIHLLQILRRHGFRVEAVTVDSAFSALRARRSQGGVKGQVPAMVIMDRLNASRGMELYQQLQHRMRIPILLIVDRESAPLWDRRDDGILVAPFSARRLLHRVRALLTHGLEEEEDTIVVGPFRLNTARQVLQRGDSVYCLTPKQCRLLAILMRRAGHVVPRRDLIRWVWGAEIPSRSRTLDVHIRWLRRILEEDPTHPRYLETVRRVGYRFRAP